VKRLGAILLALVSVAIAIACTASTDPDDGDACHPGDRVQCRCDDGARGIAACAEGRLGTCDCTFDAGGAAAPLEAPFGTYLGPCETLADCPAGGTCFDFNSKGKRCTVECMDGAQCAAPSTKCNPKRVCSLD